MKWKKVGLCADNGKEDSWVFEIQRGGVRELDQMLLLSSPQPPYACTSFVFVLPAPPVIIQRVPLRHQPNDVDRRSSQNKSDSPSEPKLTENRPTNSGHQLATDDLSLLCLFLSEMFFWKPKSFFSPYSLGSSSSSDISSAKPPPSS